MAGDCGAGIGSCGSLSCLACAEVDVGAEVCVNGIIVSFCVNASVSGDVVCSIDTWECGTRTR